MNAIIFSAIWGVVIMLSGVFTGKGVARYIALAGAVILFALNGLELYSGRPLWSPKLMDLLKFDSENLTFLAVASGASLLYLFTSGRDIEKVGNYPAEYFALIFFSLCGVALCSSFNNLLMLFLGIEIMSIPMYILTGSDKKNLKSSEASLKYFLMGAFSTGIMMMGIAFIFGGNSNGSFFLSNINISQATMPVMMATGLVFILAGLSFKVSAAPFHFWTPDVYDGAPTVFTSFMSTIVKAAGFYAFIRLFGSVFALHQVQWEGLVAFLAIATLLIGNVTAVFQQSVKRMLAYSSIAQAGFMMLALFALNEKAREAIVLYSAAYSVATIGMFAVLLKMDDYTIDGFDGLSGKDPFTAFAATIFLLSLTGIPLTAGFQAKFWVLMSVVETGRNFWILLVALIFAAVSAVYYFRVIQAIYFKPAPELQTLPGAGGRSFDIMLVLLVIIIIILGVYPEFVIGWMHH